MFRSSATIHSATNRLRGEHKRLQAQNEREAETAITRDRREQEKLISRQLEPRKRLVAECFEARQRYIQQRQELRCDVETYRQMRVPPVPDANAKRQAYLDQRRNEAQKPLRSRGQTPER